MLIYDFRFHYQQSPNDIEGPDKSLPLLRQRIIGPPPLDVHILFSEELGEQLAEQAHSYHLLMLDPNNYS
jgi:hypothetical protein